MALIRDVLAELGYRPITDYFQFSKEVVTGNLTRVLRVDLLSAPPLEKDRDKVSINRFRIRPKDIEKIHGRLTDEARGISINPIQVNLSEYFKTAGTDAITIYVPSRFNYLILKLNAFHDRHQDQAVDFGRHHAYDIFVTVTGMTEKDWENARYHFSKDQKEDYIAKAIEYQKTYFGHESALGILRLKKNDAYRKHREEFDANLPDFLHDMQDLFGE